MTIKPVNKGNFWFGVSMLALSLAGIGHTFWGSWTKNAGEAAKFFPRCIYAGLLIMGAALIVQELTKRIPPEPKALKDMKWTYPVVYTMAGILFFLTVYYIGPMVGIFLYLLSMMLAFALEPKRDLTKILIIAACCTAAVYLVFTKLILLVLPGSLLF
ncbi:hypothetical protein SDC9_136921 [bioreactor metagenome]|uniref:DUF1468 domain-containing protein n=1 Tax=bioreactor metagenome TaxID=1076179 RepID=A0A645DKH4_9ZZZZ|nr:tripartite tricarboxylate transporter TctB family protein [Candidatus Pelethousia sp.]